MNNVLCTQGNTWDKYGINTGFSSIQEIVLTSDYVSVVPSIDDIAIRRENGELVAQPISNITTMRTGKATYTVWKQKTTFIAGEYYTGYRVLSGPVTSLYWHWDTDRYILEGLGEGNPPGVEPPHPAISPDFPDYIRGKIVEVYNEHLWSPGSQHFAYISEDTDFWIDGDTLNIKNFYLLEGYDISTGLTRAGTIDLYDRAGCWNLDTYHSSRPIYLTSISGPDAIYSYSYNDSSRDHFNSNNCKGRFVFIPNGYEIYDEYIRPTFYNKTISFSSTYVADNQSSSWKFPISDRAHYMEAKKIETVSDQSPSAYPADGPQGNYYYIKTFSPITSASQTGALTDADFIGGINYDINFNNDVDIEVGQCASARIQFKTRSDVLERNSVVYYQVKQLDETSYKNVGAFIISDITKSRDVYNITAYDFLSKFDINVYQWLRPYISGRHYLSEVFTYLCEKVGVTGDIGDHCNPRFYFNFNFPQGTDEVSARTILSYLAAIGGCAAIADSTGKITFKKYAGTSSYTLNNTKYTSCEKALFTVPKIDKVHIAEYNDEEGYVSGTGNNPLNIIGNKAFYSENSTGTDYEELQSATDNIYNSVRSIPVYTPAIVSTLKDYNINVGDCITVDDDTVLIMNKSWSASGVQFTCTGSDHREVLKIKTLPKEEDLVIDKLADNVEYVADKVDSVITDDGTISYDNLTAGTIKLGGYLNEYGTLLDYDETDTQIVSIDNEGIIANDITITAPLYEGQTLTAYLSNMVARFG